MRAVRGLQTQRLVDELGDQAVAAYGMATELLSIVNAARIKEPFLRERALGAARRACTASGEAATLSTRAEQAPLLDLARGAACEVAVAFDLAAATAGCSKRAAADGRRFAASLVRLLSALLSPGLRIEPAGENR